MSLSSIQLGSSFKFTLRWHFSVILWRVNFECISSLVKIQDLISTSLLEVKPWINIGHLNESEVNLFNLNFSHSRLTTPVNVTKLSLFTRFRQFYPALNNEVLSPKIFVSIPIVSSKFISPDCFGEIKLMPFSCSAMGIFLNNNLKDCVATTRRSNLSRRESTWECPI